MLLFLSFFLLLSFSVAAQEKTEVVEIDNVLELRAQETGGSTVFKLVGEAVLTFQQSYRNQKFIQDETAGILIDDNDGIITTEYNINDGITGIQGTLGIFRNNLQFIPVEDPGEPSSTGNEPLVVERTLDELTADDQGRLVVIADLEFAADVQGNAFSTGTNYTVSDPSGSGVFRTEFWDADYIGATIPETPRSVTALVILYNQTIQIVSRSLSDLQITGIPNILALRNQAVDNETVYHLTGEAFLSYQQSFRNKKWIQDATAGIEIDDNGGIIATEYEIGDGITGISGKLNYNNDMLQFIPVEDPGEASSSGNELLVVERTLEELSSDDQGRLVLIKDLVFDEEYHGTNFATGRNMDVQDPSGSGVFRTEFYQADYIGTAVPTVAQNLTAIVRQYRETIQITARSVADFEAVGEEPRFALTFIVTDEDGEALEGAVITVAGEDYAAGQYLIEELLPGTYQYMVSLEGYHSFTGQVVIASDDIEIAVMLIAVDPFLVDVFPWMEGFEDDFPPEGWMHYQAGDAGSWETHSTAYAGDAAAYHAFTSPGEEANSWLVTPQILLPEDETMLLSFFQRNAAMGDYGYSGVWISAGSGNPLNEHFVEIYESDDAVGTYSEKMLNLADYAGKVVYLAFVYQGEDGHEWWIDNVKIEQAPDVIEVPNIAALRELGTTDGTVFRITGSVVLTHQNGNRNQKYFQDDTGAILIDDSPGIITTTYEEYDAVEGLTGTLGFYAQLLQMVPTEDPGPAVSQGNEVEPLELTLADLNPEHQAMLVIVRGVSVVIPEGQTTFASSTSYTIFDDSGESTLRTPNVNAGLDYFGTPIPTTPKDMIAIVSQFNDAMQIFPRSLDDIKDPDATAIPVAELPEVLLYPNPAQHYFTIQSDEVINQVRVFDLGGRLMISMDAAHNQVRLETGGLKNGLYIIQVVSGQKVMNQRLQISR